MTSNKWSDKQKRIKSVQNFNPLESVSETDEWRDKMIISKFNKECVSVTELDFNYDNVRKIRVVSNDEKLFTLKFGNKQWLVDSDYVENICIALLESKYRFTKDNDYYVIKIEINKNPKK